MSERHYRRRSLFWPIILIGVGVLLLLQNLGYVEEINWLLLARLWPVLLIAAGLDVLLRDVPWMGSFLGAALAVGVIGFVVYAPSLDLGITTPAQRELHTEYFEESLDDSESATIHLDVDRGQLDVFALADSANLIEVDALHRDNASMSANSGTKAMVTFRLDVFDLAFPFFFFGEDQNEIEVGINDSIPVTLEVDHGSGNANLDLSDLMIEELEVDSGSGGIEVMLPNGLSNIQLSSGSGQITVQGAAESDVELVAGVGSGRIIVNLGAATTGTVDLDAGSGSIRLTLPEGVGVQLQGSTGSGSVSVPEGLVKVSGNDANAGTWQTPGFDDAAQKLYIHFDIGSGALRIEY